MFDSGGIEMPRKLGFHVFTASDVRRLGLDDVIVQVKERAGDGPCFLTFGNFLGFDLVEVCPPYDNPGQTTALLAANLVYEFIALLAVTC
mgnify:CR=1 FL=1